MPGKRRKSRSFIISFGDIMLPLIGVVAIGLLLLAGRFFFTSGFSGGDSLPVMTPPQRERPAQAKERKERAPAPAGRASESPSAAPAPSAARAAETARPVLAVPDVSAPPAPSSGTAGRTASPAKTHPKPRPALPPKTAPAKTPSPAAAKPAPSPQQKAQSSAPGWRVQIGAFSAKSAADDVVKRLSKEGHSAVVVSEKTVHRVLVRAKDRSDASALAAKMDRSGFPGAFVLAPGPQAP